MNRPIHKHQIYLELVARHLFTHALFTFEVIFDENPPDHLSTVVITNATHQFRVVDDPCLGNEVGLEQPFSDELTTVLHNWLAEQGF